jgi:hypothetical protein
MAMSMTDRRGDAVKYAREDFRDALDELLKMSEPTASAKNIPETPLVGGQSRDITIPRNSIEGLV